MAQIFQMASSHMDLEWYLPRDENRVFFYRIFKQVFHFLEINPDFKFITDGQTCSLLDFLECEPEYKEKVQRFVREGRLEIGPLHIQPDECIPCGESLVRDLMLGIQESDRLGGHMEIGYIPDSFGHVSQLPQILNQFGIRRAFVTRGIKREYGRDVIWEGECGSRLLVTCCEYGAGSVANFEDMRYGIRMFRNREEYLNARKQPAGKYTPYSVLILGGDMVCLPDDLFEITGGDSFSTLRELFDEEEKYADCLPVIRGELRDGVEPLAGTTAERADIKILNAEVQATLSRFAEPFCAFAFRGEDYPAGILRHAWKELIECHTHDGICCCSAEDTCDELTARLKRCGSLARRSFMFAAEKIMSEMGEGKDALGIFWPQSYTGDCAAAVRVRVPRTTGYLHLYDASGAECPLLEISRHDVGTIGSDSMAVQRFKRDTEIECLVIARSLPAMGVKTYRIETSEEKSGFSGVISGEDFMENDLVSVKFNTDGTLCVIDKRNGVTKDGLFRIFCCDNAGDVYHCRTGKWTTSGKVAQSCALPSNGAFARHRITRVLDTPSGEVVCETEFILAASDARIYTRTRIRNSAENIRLWMGCPAEGKEWLRDQPFTVERSREGMYPSTGFAACDGIGVFHRGLHDTRLENGYLTVTLLQGQGRLYDGFFPDSQNDEFLSGEMLGTYTMEMALLLLEGNEKLPDLASEYVCGIRTFVWPCAAGEKSFLNMTGAVLSAYKRSEDGRSDILRVFNPDETDVKINCTETLRKVSMDEKNEMEQTAVLRAGEIATYRVRENAPDPR